LSLLGSQVDAWDLNRLQFSERLGDVIRSAGVEAIAAASAGQLTTSFYLVLLDVLSDRSNPADISTFMHFNQDVAVGLARSNPSLTHDPLAWRDLDSQEVARLLDVVMPDDDSIVAALREGHRETALQKCGYWEVATALAHDGDFSLARSVIGDTAPQKAGGTTDCRVVLLLVALRPEIDAPSTTVDCLEHERDDIGEAWLRAAVSVIATPSLDPSQALPIVFGPLHDAMTADRLPHDCWNYLDPILPSAPDPALRLRRYLLAVAQEESWSTERFGQALRGAGPFTGELLRDFENHEDWWITAAKSAVRTALGLLGR